MVTIASHQIASRRNVTPPQRAQQRNKVGNKRASKKEMGWRGSREMRDMEEGSYPVTRTVPTGIVVVVGELEK